jgi:hypothetical protein
VHPAELDREVSNRQHSTNMRFGGKHKGLENLPEAQHVDVRQQLARMAGVCPRNVGNVEAILEIAHATLIEVYHTCKSRACPSCGHRANVQWLRERWAALPDANFKGVTFTMPDLLWPFFRDNPPLARALPALAAEVIRSQVGIGHGVRVGVIAILHTFNGRLEFNSHVHTWSPEEGCMGPPISGSLASTTMTTV